MKIIKCACGCGQETTDRDCRNRPRKFIQGHSRRGKHNWWSSKPIEEITIWHCRRLARKKYFKNMEKTCKLSILKTCSGRIEVHHKDGNIRNNSLKNLTSLCARHHCLVEKGYINLKAPKNPPFHKYPNGRIIYANNKQYKKIYGEKE